jgi:hypothetical protein
MINLGLAAGAGVTPEQAQGTLIAIAPAVGSARVTSAAGNILRAFGMTVVAEEMASEERPELAAPRARHGRAAGDESAAREAVVRDEQ